ncbi:MAG TPA: hypothetical protein VFF78_07920, partial [Anaerolineaceae bacterium]|nr:hypothetical protein [Anaerolineaceae bacterium]
CMTLDALYHAFKCVMPTPELLRLAQEYWDLYREALTQTTFAYDPEGLAKEWQKDAELREQAKLSGVFEPLDAILLCSVFP